jgi:hypothetical protein
MNLTKPERKCEDCKWERKGVYFSWCTHHDAIAYANKERTTEGECGKEGKL